jgi:arabinan endo-1,5-alpha-L-arabinosidase
MGYAQVVIVCIALCVQLITCSDYKNPVLHGDFEAADPGVILVGSTYYVATTGGDSGGTFVIRASPNLVDWHEVGHIFPKGHLPSWYLNDPWAPEIHYIGGKYIAYYAMRDKAGLLCVGAAHSDVPHGPYKDIGEPLVRTPGMGSIDPTAFYNDQDQKWYLYYKSDGNAIGKPTPIWAQQLSSDGMKLEGNRTFLFQNTLSWEGPLVEAPWVISRNKTYYIFYSANGYATANYAIGVARSSSPLGPFEKYGNGPIVSSNKVFAGPGHCSVVQLHASTQFVFFYAGWDADKIGQGFRMDFLDLVRWGADDWPIQITPSYTKQPIP